jgi:excinuclease ABC subunit A
MEAYAHPLVHPLRGSRRKLPNKKEAGDWLVVKGARANNLKNLEVRIPIGRLTVISGISGSGKSSFLRGVLKPAVSAALAAGKGGRKSGTKTKSDLPWTSLEGADRIEAVYEVDQSPIGKTSRSTPATYVKVFDEIRALFAQLPEARARGYTASRFSFNTEGGRCEPCKGNGSIKLEMNFLPTTYIVCEECGGRRYAASTLEVQYNGKSIGDIMDLTIAEAAEFFAGVPKIARTLNLMSETGLGYLHLGQPSPSLSGGEAQRIKLVTELTKGIGRATNARLRQNRTPKSNLYLIEEPSIGLHLSDVKRLLEIIHHLVDDGHTVVVIEHSLEIMAEADYLIDIGPEAGDAGGEIVASGTPEEVVKVKRSRTAPFLAERLGVK